MEWTAPSWPAAFLACESGIGVFQSEQRRGTRVVIHATPEPKK
jgi:hypothetical protein